MDNDKTNSLGDNDEAASRRHLLQTGMRQALVPLLLERWYPTVVDEEFGGFYSRLSADFEPIGMQRKCLVPQARHVWTTSKAAALLPEDPRYPRVAEHGFHYLRDVMWDSVHGGFSPEVYAGSADGVWPTEKSRRSRSLMSRLLRRLSRGRVTGIPASLLQPGRKQTRRRTVRTAYDQAFAIFGLAAYYRYSARDEALELARETFLWLEKHGHDPEHGGYLRLLSDRDGEPLQTEARRHLPKDFDSTLHLIEAFTELYRVWPDDLLRRRLEELVRLVRDRMTSERGTAWVFFERDWTPVRLNKREFKRHEFENEHISFGHDIEMAALLIEACDALGLPGETATHALAKRMADHSLTNGWDTEHGGLFKDGYYFGWDDDCEIIDRSKLYWVQAETLNTLSLMATRYPDDPRDYAALFEEHWRYCNRYMIDHTRGGWYWQGLDVLPAADQPGKATPVTATYHVARALMNTIGRLA